jgi:hypothetical protein
LPFKGKKEGMPEGEAMIEGSHGRREERDDRGGINEARERRVRKAQYQLFRRECVKVTNALFGSARSRKGFEENVCIILQLVKR